MPSPDTHDAGDAPDDPATPDPDRERDTPAIRKQALVAALQWGLVPTFVLASLGGLAESYYRTTTGAVLPPDWVATVETASLAGLLVGGVAGYGWVTRGPGATTSSAHRDRVVFVGALVVGWFLEILPAVALEAVFGDRLYAVPYVVLPVLVVVAVPLGAYLLAYRADGRWSRQSRRQVNATIQGVLGGFLLALFGLQAYAGYLTAAGVRFDLDGGLAVLVSVGVGGVAGYVLADPERSYERASELLVLAILSGFGVTLAMALGFAALGAAGYAVTGPVTSSLVAVAPVAVALSLSGYLALGAGTSVHRLFV